MNVTVAALLALPLVMLTPVPKVYLNASLHPGLNAVVLPVAPLAETIDVNGCRYARVVACIDILLYLYSSGYCNAAINYIGVAEVYDRLYRVRLLTRALILVPSNIVILEMPNVTSFHVEEGNVILEVEPGVLEYLVVRNPVARIPFETLLAYVAAVSIPLSVLAARLALKSRRGRAGESPPGEPELQQLQLDDLDRAILTEVVRSGGTLLQSELYRRLNAPRTTIWRHVQRLAKAGLIEILKEPDGRNRIAIRNESVKRLFQNRNTRT